MTPAALLLGIVCSPDIGSPMAAQTPRAVWQPAGEGVEHATAEHGGAAVAELLRFDLTRVRVDVVVPGAARPQTAAQARLEAGAMAAVNGGFFDEAGRPLGLRVGSGRTLVPLRPRVDWGVLVVEDATARIVHSRDYKAEPAVRAALQVGPRILVRGKPTRLKPQVARRTAVALDPNGRYLTLVVTLRPFEAGALAGVLAALGFDSALMLDGGPSTQLSAWLGGRAIDVPGGYPVPDLLVITGKSPRPRAVEDAWRTAGCLRNPAD